MTRYRSQDGLMSSPDPAAVEAWDRIGREMTNARTAWTERLRTIGVKLAHPDDGWVHEPGRGYTPNNHDKWLSPSWYAQFDDGPQEGDLIALGWPDTGYRIVQCIEVRRRPTVLGGESVCYYYEDTGQRLPEPPKRSIIQRILAGAK